MDEPFVKPCQWLQEKGFSQCLFRMEDFLYFSRGEDSDVQTNDLFLSFVWFWLSTYDDALEVGGRIHMFVLVWVYSDLSFTMVHARSVFFVLTSPSCQYWCTCFYSFLHLPRGHDDLSLSDVIVMTDCSYVFIIIRVVFRYKVYACILHSTQLIP